MGGACTGVSDMKPVGPWVNLERVGPACMHNSTGSVSPLLFTFFLPALTLNVNNFLLILKQTPPNSLTFIWQEFGMTYLGVNNLTFPWQPYFDKHIFRNFDFLAVLIRIVHVFFVIFTSLDRFSVLGLRERKVTEDNNFFITAQAQISITARQPRATVTERSDFTFEWDFHLPSSRSLSEIVFGIWEKGYTSSYFITVNTAGVAVENPELGKKHPNYVGRVKWAGDISRSYAAFRLLNIKISDNKTYGCQLGIGGFGQTRDSKIALIVEVRLDYFAVV